MAADASIYSLIRPVQPGPGPLQNYGQAMQLRALIDDQGLKQLQRQQLERGIADEEALRGVEMESMGDPAKMREGLSKRGLYRQRMDFDKRQVDTNKAEADAMKIDRENFIALTDSARKRMAAVRDQPTWQMFRDEQIQMAGMFKTPAIREAAMRAAQSMPAEFNPNYIRDSLVKAEELFTPKIEMRDLGGKVVPVDVNPFTNPAILRQDFTKTATPGEMLTDERTRSEGALNRGVTIRGQNLTDARARETTGAGRIPPGYRMTAEGNLEAIPGGPADIKAGEAGAKAEAKKEALAAAAGNVLNTIREAKGLVGWTTAGPGGAASTIPMTDARKLAGHIETIKANIGFDRLQQMRDLSPTGGALGQVAVQELNALQATIAKLDQLQHPNDLKEALGKIEQHYSRWLDTMKGQNPEQKPGGPKVFDSMPDPSKYAGKRMEADDGTIYKSDGKRWVRQ